MSHGTRLVIQFILLPILLLEYWLNIGTRQSQIVAFDVIISKKKRGADDELKSLPRQDTKILP